LRRTGTAIGSPYASFTPTSPRAVVATRARHLGHLALSSRYNAALALSSRYRADVTTDDP
jgi:hypothetical protein